MVNVTEARAQVKRFKSQAWKPHWLHFCQDIVRHVFIYYFDYVSIYDIVNNVLFLLLLLENPEILESQSNQNLKRPPLMV